MKFGDTQGAISQCRKNGTSAWQNKLNIAQPLFRDHRLSEHLMLEHIVLAFDIPILLTPTWIVMVYPNCVACDCNQRGTHFDWVWRLQMLDRVLWYQEHNSNFSRSVLDNFLWEQIYMRTKCIAHIWKSQTLTCHFKIISNKFHHRLCNNLANKHLLQYLRPNSWNVTQIQYSIHLVAVKKTTKRHAIDWVKLLIPSVWNQDIYRILPNKRAGCRGRKRTFIL